MSSTHDLSSLESAELPHLLDRYLLQRLIGKGARGLVFEAELQGPVGFRKQVALKLLKTPEGGPTEKQRQELVGEARLGGLLRHPNIVDTYELGEHEGRFFISLELVDGMSMEQIFREQGALPPLAALDVACQACAGLAHAHALKVAGRSAQFVHRDLKLGNILVTRDGLVKLVDFGISSALGVTDTPKNQGIVGTPAYMSPEQALREPLDARSDLFSLGVILYQMLTGTRLFPGKTPARVLQNVLNVDEFLKLSDPLATAEAVLPGSTAVLSRCLAADRELRQSSAFELAAELDGLRAGAGEGPSLLELLNELLQGNAAHGTPWRQPLTGDPSIELDPLPTDGQEPPSADGTPPPNAAPDPPRTNLAREQDRFVGREDDMEALSACFEKGAQLVTLKGLGGAGKTRLAQRFASLYLEESPGGVWWVDLTEALSKAGVLDATATGLGVPLGGGDFEGMVSQLGHALAGRGPVLVVMDNFEQVVETAPDTVGRWLAMAPEARFIATSRESLKLSGEEVLSLAPLVEKDGIALFELRARSAGAHWKDTKENQAAVTRIVRELDGLPLAIELAAARAQLLSPVQLLDRLSKRFELLRDGRRGASKRQATLEGLIDWSWNLLEDWEKATLAQLSVFRGGFFMEAAEAVVDLSLWPEAPWSLDVVGSLLDKSLLYNSEVVERPRFGMFKTIQGYSGRKLASAAPPVGGGAALRAAHLRHAKHYAQLGDSEALHALNAEGRADRWSALFVEIENLVVSVGAGLATGHLEEAVGAVRGAAAILGMKGPATTAVLLLERVMAEPGLSAALRVSLMRRYGRLLGIVGRTEQAFSVFAEGLSCAQDLGDLLSERHLHQSLGYLCIQQNRQEEAHQHYSRALSMAREQGDQFAEASCLVSTAGLHRTRGDIDKALSLYEEALAINREVGNRDLERWMKNSMGGMYREMGRLDEALLHLERSLSLSRQAGNRQAEGSTLGMLGLTYTELGRYDEALACSEQGLQIMRRIGSRSSVGIALGNIADFLILQGDWQGAESRLAESIDILDSTYPIAAGAFRGSLALVRAHQGDFVEARALLDWGEEVLRDGYAFEFGKILCRRGTVETLAGDLEAAQAALAKAKAIAIEIKASEDSELGVEMAELRKKLAAERPPD